MSEQVNDYDHSVVLQEIKNSSVYLTDLLEEGSEMVSNVQVASDAREVERQSERTHYQSSRIRELEQHNIAEHDQYTEISSTWLKILKAIDCVQLHAANNRQKEKCDELINSKNSIIKNLEEQLKIVDEKYVNTQTLYREDVSFLAERIDKHVSVMHEAYKMQLDVIQMKIDGEYLRIMNAKHQEWRARYENQLKNTDDNLNEIADVIAKHEQTSTFTRSDYYEKFHRIRSKLDDNTHNLRITIEDIKALCLINSEMLDYNYEYLRRKKDETATVKSELRRKCNRFREIICNLRLKRSKLLELKNKNVKKWHEKIAKQQRLVEDATMKLQHFARINGNTFMEMWKLNLNRAKSMLHEILNIDELLHQEVLHVEWTTPKLPLLSVSDLPSYKMIVHRNPQLFAVQGKSDQLANDIVQNDIIDNDRIAKFILLTIAKNSDMFPNEDKFSGILNNFTENEKTLIKLNNISEILGIVSKQQIENLKKYFQPYIKCATCENTAGDQTLSYLSRRYKSTTERSTSASCCLMEKHYRFGALKKRPYSSPAYLVSVDGNGVKEDTLFDTNISPNRHLICLNNGHQLFIEKYWLSKAVESFRTCYNKFVPNENGTKSQQSLLRYALIARQLSVNDIEIYWKRFPSVINHRNELKLWDALSLAFGKYQNLLQCNQTLKTEVELLRARNDELKRLLQPNYTCGQNRLKNSTSPTRD